MTDRELVHQALDMLKQAKDSVTDREAMKLARERLELWLDERNLPEDAAAIAALRERLAQPEQEPVAHCEAGPEHCPVCLKELSSAQQKPVAEVKRMMTGGNAGIATRIVEIDDPMRERLHPGQMLYTAPPQRKPLTDEQADSIINGLRTCLHLDSKRMFLKTWLRDWAAHGIKE